MKFYVFLHLNLEQKRYKDTQKKETKMGKYNFLVILNCKAVDGRQTERGARRCASAWCKKYPANEGNVVEVYDAQTGIYII